MSVLTALARLRAAEAGRAQPVATVRHCHLHDRPLVVVPLRLAGEAAAPLAAMVGTRPDEPSFFAVPQPRNRDLRFAFAAELAGVIVPYLESFQADAETVTNRAGEERERCLDAPQVLVPNRAGAGFLRLLGRSTRFRRPDGDFPVDPSVPLLGRWLTWLADKADYPGSAVLPAMTDLLALHWATGQSALEDGNLAALMGWIDPPDGMTGAEAAALAEDPALWPPAGPATDPGFDNGLLAPAVSAYDREPGADTAERVRELLRGQVEPTWRLMWRAVELLRELPEAASVPDRWLRDRESYSAFAQSIPDGLPQARRDSAVAAAVRLDRMERAQADYEAQRAFDDPLVMAEARLAGDAFGGVVVWCDAERLDESGKRARPRPYVRVRTEDPLRVSVGGVVNNADRPAQKAMVVELTGNEVLLELTSGMGGGRTPKPGSVPEVGDRVCFASFETGRFGQSRFPEKDETPWTHGGPPEEYVPTEQDAREEWE